MADEERTYTPAEVAPVIRALGAHRQEHRADDGECPFCDLFDAFRMNSVRAIDKAVARHAGDRAVLEIPRDERRPPADLETEAQRFEDLARDLRDEAARRQHDV